MKNWPIVEYWIKFYYSWVLVILNTQSKLVGYLTSTRIHASEWYCVLWIGVYTNGCLYVTMSKHRELFKFQIAKIKLDWILLVSMCKVKLSTNWLYDFACKQLYTQHKNIDAEHYNYVVSLKSSIHVHTFEHNVTMNAKCNDTLSQASAVKLNSLHIWSWAFMLCVYVTCVWHVCMYVCVYSIRNTYHRFRMFSLMLSYPLHKIYTLKILIHGIFVYTHGK